MNNIIAFIESDLIQNVDEKNKKSFPRFFKESVKCYGVKTAVVKRIAGKYYKEIKQKNKKDVFRFMRVPSKI